MADTVPVAADAATAAATAAKELEAARKAAAEAKAVTDAANAVVAEKQAAARALEITEKPGLWNKAGMGLRNFGGKVVKAVPGLSLAGEEAGLFGLGAEGVTALGLTVAWPLIGAAAVVGFGGYELWKYEHNKNLSDQVTKVVAPQAVADAKAGKSNDDPNSKLTLQKTVEIKDSWDASKKLLEGMADPKTGLDFAKSLNDGPHKLTNNDLRRVLGLGKVSDPLEPAELAKRVKELQEAAKDLPKDGDKLDWDAIYNDKNPNHKAEYESNAYARAVKSASQDVIEKFKQDGRDDLSRMIGHADAATENAAANTAPSLAAGQNTPAATQTGQPAAVTAQAHGPTADTIKISGLLTQMIVSPVNRDGMIDALGVNPAFKEVQAAFVLDPKTTPAASIQATVLNAIDKLTPQQLEELAKTTIAVNQTADPLPHAAPIERPLGQTGRVNPQQQEQQFQGQQISAEEVRQISLIAMKLTGLVGSEVSHSFFRFLNPMHYIAPDRKFNGTLKDIEKRLASDPNATAQDRAALESLQNPRGLKSEEKEIYKDFKGKNVAQDLKQIERPTEDVAVLLANNPGLMRAVVGTLNSQKKTEFHVGTPEFDQQIALRGGGGYQKPFNGQGGVGQQLVADANLGTTRGRAAPQQQAGAFTPDQADAMLNMGRPAPASTQTPAPALQFVPGNS